MTPAEVETYCRRATDTVNETDFVSSAEIIDNYLYAACLQVSQLIPCIETYQTDTSVANQQTYSLPSAAFKIKRVQYDGQKLKQITMRQWDSYEGLDNTDQSTGTPDSYWIWGDYFYLYPIPDENNKEIAVWSNDYHDALDSTDGSETIDIPAAWHARLCNYVISQIYLKDQDPRANQYLQMWEQVDKPMMMREWRQRQTRDGFKKIQTRKSLAETDYGII